MQSYLLRVGTSVYHPMILDTSTILTPASFVRRWRLRSDSETLQVDYVAKHQASFCNRYLRRSIIDPFVRLPVDNTLDIADLLSTRDVLLLSIASPTVSQYLDNSNFWRRRISRDMPWIWDLPLADATNLTNCRKVHFDLQNMCNYDSHLKNLNLINKKQI